MVNNTNSDKKIIKTAVEGVVIEKEHKEQSCHITYNVALKTPTLTYDEETYNVYVKYDGLKAVFNNKKLYNKAMKNKKINLLLIERIDSKGKVIKRTLKLPE